MKPPRDTILSYFYSLDRLAEKNTKLYHELGNKMAYPDILQKSNKTYYMSEEHVIPGFAYREIVILTDSSNFALEYLLDLIESGTMKLSYNDHIYQSEKGAVIRYEPISISERIDEQNVGKLIVEQHTPGQDRSVAKSYVDHMVNAISNYHKRFN